MIEPLKIDDFINPKEFISKLVSSKTSNSIEELLSLLPIIPHDDYVFNPDSPEQDWKNGSFHWQPVGHDRGNAGRIKLANEPINPIAERTVNGSEALIELMRQRELKNNPTAEMPNSPREAVLRYFNLPPLDQIPKIKLNNPSKAKEIRSSIQKISKNLRVRLVRDKKSKQFTVSIEDDGIGQAPENIHKTLLSLGSTTKADKDYLIGVFGQGGSSAYAVSQYSWLCSMRAPDLLSDSDDGLGWTIIKHCYPKGRRDDYFAYLSCHPDGRVPSVTRSIADELNIKHGTRFTHIDYDFGKGGSQIARQLYRELNHILYNPVLPFDLYSLRDSADRISGNAYRLSLLSTRKGHMPLLDKQYPFLNI